MSESNFREAFRINIKQCREIFPCMSGLGASVSQLVGNSGMALARLDHRQKVAFVLLILFHFLYLSTYYGKSKLLYHGRGHIVRNSRQSSQSNSTEQSHKNNPHGYTKSINVLSENSIRVGSENHKGAFTQSNQSQPDFQ